MYKNLNLAKKIYIPLLSLIILSLFVIAVIGYVSIKQIKNEIIANNKNSLKNIFCEKLEAKKIAAKVGAIAIANDSVIKKALMKNDKNLAYEELKNLTAYYRKHTKFKNIKIHIHTDSLRSFLRVWKKNKNGDYLGSFRKSLVWVRKNKKPLVALEVGKSGLMLRGIAPVEEKGRYLGSIEFIQGLNSISRELLKKDVYVMIFMEKKYLKTADYFNSREKIGSLIPAIKKSAYSHKFFMELISSDLNKETVLTKNYFAVKIPIKDFSKETIGYAFVGENIKSIREVINSGIYGFVKQIAVILVIDIVLIYLFVYLVSKVVLKPVEELKNGLKSFFDYLADPSKKIKPIQIDTGDELGEIASFTNEGIRTSSKLHNEIMELMGIIDENVLICEIDFYGYIIGATKAFCKTSGFEKKDLINKRFTNLIAPKQKREIINITDALKKDSVYKSEIKLNTKGGGYFWCRVIISKQCEYDDETNCKYVLIGYDITDKKKVEQLSKNLEKKVTERTAELLEAKNEIEKLLHNTKESIKFASMIQKSLLPQNDKFAQSFKDYFVIWKPKDIVGGDIYLFELFSDENESVLMVVDCTGHGVPGAFVTMIVKALEREIISNIKKDTSFISPKIIMEHLNKTLKKLLKQDTNTKNNVGFDGGIIHYDKTEKTLKYCGARTPLFIVEDNKITEIKGDKHSVGCRTCREDFEFSEHVVKVKESMKFYITTDGFLDQLGGNKDLPFGKSRFKKLIINYHSLPFEVQKRMFLNELENYKKTADEEQNDDITVIGFEIETQIQKEVILEYDGVITQGIIGHFTDILEEKTQNLGVSSKLSTVLIELTQNIMKYAYSEDGKTKKGNVKIVKTGDMFTVETKNLISAKDQTTLRHKLRHIKTLSKDEIKKEYRELRKSGKHSHDRGAGIGFYEIARNIDGFEFEFFKINAFEFLFSFRGYLKA